MHSSAEVLEGDFYTPCLPPPCVETLEMKDKIYEYYEILLNVFELHSVLGRIEVQLPFTKH